MKGDMARGVHAAFPGDLNHGLSKREYYAAAALTGMLANPEYVAGAGKTGEEVGLPMGRVLAVAAFDMADLMLEAARRGGS